MPGPLPTDRTPDDELLGRIAAGDAQAFSELFRRRHLDVFRFALHMSGSAATAEDVVQDVFLAVMRDAARYDEGRASVASWLCGIARNCVRQRADRDRRLAPADLAGDREPAPGSPAPADPLTGLLQTERIDTLRRAIQTLPLPYREALVLCDLQEQPYVEAARSLGCPVGTVRSRLHRARALLSSKLTATGLAGRTEPGAAAGKQRDDNAGDLQKERAGAGGCFA